MPTAGAAADALSGEVRSVGTEKLVSRSIPEARGPDEARSTKPALTLASHSRDLRLCDVPCLLGRGLAAA